MVDLFSDQPNDVQVRQMGKTCRTCTHLFCHQYNSRMKYCGQRRQKGTAYGFKKIKASDPACPKYEPKE